MIAFLKTVLVVFSCLICGIFSAVVMLPVQLHELCSVMVKLDPKKIVTKKKTWRTMPQAVKEFAPSARRRMRPAFKAAGVPYPPSQLTLAGLKEEQLLILLAPDSEGTTKTDSTYPILDARGEPGPQIQPR
ncbi:MAG: hypothetical protein SGJ27_24085, partial [Candidatus Melainabacteria bacterium]|nr:hypothetical protein [Candidatus Melainabacteria bacterium]